MSLALWLMVALALNRAQFRLGLFSYQSTYNGYGAIDSVNARTADAPMVYRVLVPWLIAAAERMIPALRARRLPWLYEAFKVLSLAGALWMCERAVGVRGALVIAALLPATFHFDYWDWTVELFAFAAALSGNFGWAAVGIVLGGMARETTPLAALTFGLKTNAWGEAILLGALALGTLGAVRWVQGKHPLYCERVMWRVNWDDVRGLMRNRPVYTSEMFMTLLLSGLIVAAALRTLPTGITALMLVAAGWVLARAAETRVFTAGLLWVGLACAGWG